MPKGDEITTKFRVDISDLKAGIADANQQIKLANAEFKAATAGMDDWAKSADGIKAKLNQLESVLSAQKTKLEAYTKELERQQSAYDENGRRAAELRAKLEDLADKGVSKTSKEYKEYENALAACEKEQESNKKAVDDLKITILNQQAAVNKTGAEIGKYNTSLDALEKEEGEAEKSTKDLDKSVDEIGESAEKTGGKFDGLGKKIAAGVAAGLAALGTAAVAAGKGIWEMSNRAAEAGDAIDKQSQKVGLSYESYQKWDYAMQLAGTSMSSCTTGLKTLTNTFDDAQNGSEGAIKKFERLGLSLDDLEGKSREEVFGAVVEALQGVADETEKAALANDMFGKSGQDLLPLLNQSAEATQELLQQAEDYGMVMSDEAVKASAEFEDSLTRMRGTISGIKNNLMGDMLPSITTLLDGFTDLAAGVDGGGEKIQEGVSGIIASIEQMIPQAVEFITRIAQAVLEAAPEIIVSLASGISSSIPIIIQELSAVLPGIVTTIVKLLVESIPVLLDGAIQLFMALVEALPVIIQELSAVLPEVVTTIVELLVDSIPVLLDGAIQLFMALIEALPIIITALTSALPEIVSKIVEVLIENVPVLLAGAVQLFMALVEAIPIIVQSLIEALPQIVEAFQTGLFEPVGEVFADLWDEIVAIWEVAAGWFDENVIQPVTRFFAGLWDGIVKTFGDVKGWFEEKFTSARDAILGAWSTVSAWFSGVWSEIAGVYEGVKSWFSERFEGAVNGIKTAFGAIGSWFSSIWEGIKKTFEPVSTWFGGIFRDASDAIKAPLNAIISGVNAVIDGLNALSIDIPDWVPGFGGKKFGFDIARIPKLEQGGILPRGQMGLLEGSGAEAVVPLERNKAWISEVAGDMLRQIAGTGGGAAGTVVGGSREVNFTQIINAPKAPSRIELYRQTRNLLSYARATGGV